jgi:MFS family permease
MSSKISVLAVIAVFSAGATALASLGGPLADALGPDTSKKVIAWAVIIGTIFAAVAGAAESFVAKETTK